MVVPVYCFSGTFDTGVRLTAEKLVHVTLVASDNVLEIYISGRKYISERAFLLAPTSGSFVLSADQSEGKILFTSPNHFTVTF